MNKAATSVVYSLYLLLFTALANSYCLLAAQPTRLFLAVPLLLWIALFAGALLPKTGCKRLRVTCHGLMLLAVFLPSAVLSVVYHVLLAVRTIPGDWQTLLWSALLCIGLQALLFWDGILCVYLTSTQLGVKQRVVGAVCGMIPIVNLLALLSIMKTVRREIRVELEKEAVNRRRQPQQVCATRYPLLLVHGVFFRDNRYFNYWGRIPRELEQNGATIYYGNHQSAASVADSAAELTARIKELVAQTGCEKVNIIAHSKGGLDCRYAIHRLGAAPFVASLTTVNTPHRGCEFADYLLTKIPVDVKNKVADAYNKTLKKLGDPHPDFLAAVNDLTAARCAAFDRETETPTHLFTQSVGSLLPRAASGHFPLNFSYHLVKYFDGPNDGLVSEKAFRWGEKYTLLSPPQENGISHGDVIDLTRRNVEGFDVREFYVGLVSDLKDRGL